MRSFSLNRITYYLHSCSALNKKDINCNAFLSFFRSQFSLKRAAAIILGMLLLAIGMSSPLFFIARIERLVSFQDTFQMEDVLICREIWPQGWRIAYKTFSCIFQFLGPVIIVVSGLIFSFSSPQIID